MTSIAITPSKFLWCPIRLTLADVCRFCPNLSRAPHLPQSADVGIQTLPARRERQQRDIPGLLDGLGKTALVRRAHTRQASRNNLAALGNKLAEQANVFVVDVVDLLGAELAHFLAPENRAATFTAAWTSTWTRSTRSTTGAFRALLLLLRRRRASLL